MQEANIDGEPIGGGDIDGVPSKGQVVVECILYATVHCSGGGGCGC